MVAVGGVEVERSSDVGWEVVWVGVAVSVLSGVVAFVRS